ncbi:hypothetical protein, partial [Plasmodium yoelii yoelii]
MDVLAVDHHAQDHGIAMLLHPAGHLEFVFERLGAGEFIVQQLFRRLDADLDVVEAGRLQFGDADFVQAVARGDEVGVIAELAGVGDDFGQVAAGQRFTAGKPQLDGTERAGLTQHPLPFFGAQLVTQAGVIQGVGAIGTLQRAGVGQLRQQPARLSTMLVRLCWPSQSSRIAAAATVPTGYRVADSCESGDVEIGRFFVDIGEVHGVQHRPQDVELELEDFQGPFLLFAGLEMIQRDFDAVLDIAAGLSHPLAEIGQAVGCDPRIQIRPASQALFVDGRRKQLGERRAGGFLPGRGTSEVEVGVDGETHAGQVMDVVVLFLGTQPSLEFFAAPGDRNFDPGFAQGTILWRIFIQNRVGVVDVDQDLASIRQGVQDFQHAARTGLRQVAHLTCKLVADAGVTHFVFAPESSVDQEAVRGFHGGADVRLDLPQARRIVELAAVFQIFDDHAD